MNWLRDKIADLIIIHIRIANEEDAYEIFETTNARGVDLSVADLLKNFIFKKIPEKENKDFAKEIWTEITNNVQATNTDLKKFIRYYWISKYSFVTEKKLFKEIKKEITNWNQFLQDMWDSSEWYYKLYEGNRKDFFSLKNGGEIYDSILALRLMGVSQCYVLLLSILSNYNKLGTNPLDIIKLIENFTFHYSAVSKLPGNKVEKIYSKYAIKIQNVIDNDSEKNIHKNIQKIFKNIEKDLLTEKPLKEVFISSFNDLVYKNSSQVRMLIKYILSYFNSFYRKTKEEIINFNNVNIEHILPLNPDDSWGLSKKEIKPYVNNLGNLTIISKEINSKVQNKTIAKKLPDLKDSALPVTKKLIEEYFDKNKMDWGEAEIKKRQKDMAELAYNNIWKLN